MPSVIDGLHAVTVHITDLARARKFYRDVLELREVSVDEKAQRAVYAIPNSPTLLTMHIMAPAEGGREPGTVSGIVFHSDDPTGACAEVKRHGGTVTVEPVLVEVPGAKFLRGVIADPDGNEFVITNRTD
jgi:predicted enzyme related to lactoylglutathione lyase